ncbi:MAG: BBE domain-containing protein, partial [Anaerolineae bacterium]|nr:BBE domain-containing protein [Anaerolineae bacterium]
PMRYVEMFPPEEAGYHPLAEGRSLFMDKLETSDAALILEQIAASTGQMAVTQLRVLGGAAARVPADATAYAHRARRLMVNVAALYGNPEEKSVHATWVNHFAAALQQGEADVYVNFLGNEGEARVRAAYPGATWDRLASVKAQYDPTNFFRQNHNIQPSAE